MARLDDKGTKIDGSEAQWKVGSVLKELVVSALVAALVFRPWNDQSHQRYTRAAVGANGHECAAIGRDILEKNGSAVDAAIATLFCEGVSCAQCMGLGGGFIATIYDASTGRVRVLNARERAPAGTTIDMFQNKSATIGGLAIAIPGELRGYGAMHREYGRLPWRDLVRPTAKLCRDGHYVNAYMAHCLKIHSKEIKTDPTMREIYVNEETGNVWHEGNIIVEPVLAETLDTIAVEGPEAMYTGSLAQRLVADIAALGGIITASDLWNYKVEWQEPVMAEIDKEHTLYTSRTPGSGSILVFIFNMLRDWVDTASVRPDSDLYWHRIIETFKFAYAKRTGLGDPSHFDVPYDIRELERNLSDAQWARSHRDLVDDKRTFNNWRHYGALYEGADDHGTGHALVIAPDGSVVSVTSTINYVWGCQRRSQRTGILLNNEMDDFAIPNLHSSYGMPPSPANMLAPGKTPLSSMVPSIVLNKAGEPVLAIGAAGGTKITTQVYLVTRHTILERQGLISAITRPRLHHQLMPMELLYEDDFDAKAVASLRAKGHMTVALHPDAVGFAAIVAAAREPDLTYVAISDPRRAGSVDGF